MLILGLSSFKNDTAAALMRDGTMEAAIENAKLQPAVTRGIPEAEARGLLLHAFLEDAVAEIANTDQRELVRTELLAALKRMA